MIRIRKFIKFYIILFFTLFAFTFSSFCLASESYIWTSLDPSILTSNTDQEAVSSSNSLNLESGSAILIEQHSGKI